MLLTVNDINTEEIFDYCVVGAGPAGITLARKLAFTGKRVVMLEGGKEHRTEASQRLYQGEIIGDKYIGLAKSRLRFFGGSSNHWGGWCRALNEEDFHAKGGFTDTEWPINKSDLEPYLQEASSIVDIGEIPQDRPFGSSGLMQFYFAVSNPLTRFASKVQKRHCRVQKHLSHVEYLRHLICNKRRCSDGSEHIYIR
jgi:choline dehydrogenase-like flavoprotein